MAGRVSSKQKTKKRANYSKKYDTSVLDDNDILKKIPTKLVSCLMPFQREGVLFAVRKDGRCLIADEMGLGKTLQAIAVACYFQPEWPLLIIVPSSLRYAWIEELERWVPEILPHEINLIQGGFDTSGIAEAKVTIVTYGLLSCKSSATVKEALQARQFRVAICDESHYFKNSRTVCCKAVTPLLTSAERCILLSGTPALAKPSELFTQLDALLPGKFGSFWSFTSKYCAGHWEYFGRRRQWRADGASSLDELQQRLQTVMIRREKNNVLSQLPPKQRQKILFALKDSSTKKEILSTFAELKPLLKRSRSSLATNLLGGDRDPANKGPAGEHSAEQTDTNILSRIQRLYNLTGEAKIGPAREYIQMLCENANLKFLVFAYHHTMMDGLQQTLWDKKIKFVRIDGQTKPSDRQLYVQQFQSDKNIRVAILSILAAGVGLTLTAATLVVFAELYWTPGVIVQCEDRAHRIGQTSAVPIHYLVARDTMDEWVWSAVCRKTLVTSTALTGKRCALQADAGDRYQVELLSAADAYTPVDDAEIDISELIQSQLPQDQKSILDYFCSQSDHSQCIQTSSEPSSTYKASRNSDNIMESEDSSSITTTSTLCDTSRKRPFPIFTSLKKPAQTGWQKKVSQGLVIIDSSDDEVVGVYENSSNNQNVTGAKNKLNAFKTESGTHTKIQKSRKRKCGINSAENDSDSQFEDTPSNFSHSEKKKKKCSSKLLASLPRTPKTASKKSAGGASHAHSAEASSRLDVDMVDGKHWSCSACTFSNSSLLPFCEVCETPRKQKAETNGEKASVPEKLPEIAHSDSHLIAHSDSHLLLEDDLAFSTPVCSSVQVSKQSSQNNCAQSLSMEPVSEEEQGENVSFKDRPRHRMESVSEEEQGESMSFKDRPRHRMESVSEEEQGESMSFKDRPRHRMESVSEEEQGESVLFKDRPGHRVKSLSMEPVSEEEQGESMSFKGRPRHRMESVSEEEQGESVSFKDRPRHRVKRNLKFGVLSRAECLMSSEEENNSHTSPKSVNWWRNGTLESSCMDSKDSESELVCFQLNSSMEKNDGYSSPCLCGSENEEQETLVVSYESSGQITSCSSTDSAQPCSKRMDLSVVEPTSLDSSRKSKSAGSYIADSTADNKFYLDNSDEMVKKDRADVDHTGDNDLSEVKPPKRKSFMLGIPQKYPAEVSPTKHSPQSVGSSFRDLSDGAGETNCAENLTVHCIDLTPKQKITDLSPEKRTSTPKKPNHAKRRLTSSVKADECDESEVVCREETLSCGPADDRTEDSRAIEGTSADLDEQENSVSGGVSVSEVVCREETLSCGPADDRTEDSRAIEGTSADLDEQENNVSGGVSISPHCDLPQASDPVHSSFIFCCSSYTGRVYLFDMHGESLKANFLPLDVELDNLSELPELLHHPQHLRLAQHFVRQWNSLTDTKRRLISKRGLKFHSPLAAYDIVRTDLANNKQRYQPKEDQVKAAVKRAKEINGSVRVLSKHHSPAPLSSTIAEDQQSDCDGISSSNGTTHNWPQGYVQAMSSDGTPLCVHCQQPCSSLVSREMSDSKDTAWHSRFCSRVCADAHWMKTNTAYLRSSVYDVQHGICQLCDFDAHTFFCQIRDSVDRKQRAETINSSKFSKLGAGQKKQMIARPYEGLFWHVDHIRPVWEGGGQCDIDNLRTLCTPCHQSVTAKQAAKHAHARKFSKAACSGDITAFFKKSC